MRNSTQPSVHINYFNDEISYYSWDENEIVVDYGDNMNAILYHEYRHYLQYKKYPKWTEFEFWCLEKAQLSLVFAFLLIGTKFAMILPIVMICLSIPILITELDANIFAYKRLIKKNMQSQVKSLIYGQLQYIAIFVVIPAVIIFKSL